MEEIQSILFFWVYLFKEREYNVRNENGKRSKKEPPIPFSYGF